MLRAFALNPAREECRFTWFPPPECEILQGCDDPHATQALWELTEFLTQQGVVPEWEANFDAWPDAWRKLPGLGASDAFLLFDADLIEQVRRQLVNYTFDPAAFAAYWSAAPYHWRVAQEDVVPLIPALLSFLKQSLARAGDAELLMVFSPPLYGS